MRTRWTVSLAIAAAAAVAACGTTSKPSGPGDPAGRGAEPVATPPAPELPPIPKLWDWNDPAASEARFRDAAAQARAAGARGYEAEAWTQVARAQGLQKRYDDAHATLATVVPMLRDGETVPRVRWELEKGRTLRSSGRPAEAKPHFMAAWELASAAGGDVGLALDAAHMVALVLPPDEALTWAFKAIAIAESSEDPRAKGWLGPLYNNTGWTLFERGEHALALDLWRSGVAVREGGADAQGLRVAKWTVARGLRALGRHDEAVAILDALRVEFDAMREPDGYVFEELAENHLAQGRKAEAKAEFLRAWELLREADDVKRDAARSERLRTAAGL